MPEWLLTKEEWEAIIAALPEGDTCGRCRKAINQAALKKVALALKRLTGSNKALPGLRLTVWRAKGWAALMREAGLDKEALDI